MNLDRMAHWEVAPENEVEMVLSEVLELRAWADEVIDEFKMRQMDDALRHKVEKMIDNTNGRTDAEREVAERKAEHFRSKMHAEQATRQSAKRSHEETLRQRFQDFHEKNPQVYDELVRLARETKSAGAKKVSINRLFELLRHEHALNGSDLKLNNSHRSHYVRLIEKQEEDLRGSFETRRSPRVESVR